MPTDLFCGFAQLENDAHPEIFSFFVFRGDCNSCVLTVGGNRVKPCVGKVPPEPKLKSLIENGLEVR